MAAQHTTLNVEDVHYDPDNPRIAHLLGQYEDIDPDLVAMALQPHDAKFNELKQAIRTHEGIINPIIVNRRDGQLIAIEGNTRLAIYKRFHSDAPAEERWQTIPAIVYDEMTQTAIDAIRLQAHLVGVRNWSPFAKAQFLYKLNKSEHLSLSSLVDFCGGNKQEVLRNIQAYEQMTQVYKPLVPEDEFDQHKFSLFYEAEKGPVRHALIKSGFTAKDFATWVREGKFEPRQELVRKLPKILQSDRAREEFLSNGAATAEKYIENPSISKELAAASLVDLCIAVQRRIADLRLQERDDIRNDDDNIMCVEDTLAARQHLYEYEIARE